MTTQQRIILAKLQEQQRLKAKQLEIEEQSKRLEPKMHTAPSTSELWLTTASDARLHNSTKKMSTAEMILRQHLKVKKDN